VRWTTIEIDAPDTVAQAFSTELNLAVAISYVKMPVSHSFSSPSGTLLYSCHKGYLPLEYHRLEGYLQLVAVIFVAKDKFYS